MVCAWIVGKLDTILAAVSSGTDLRIVHGYSLNQD